MGVSLRTSQLWCRRITRRKAGNFYFAFLPLPSQAFQDMCVLYAFMRVTDDLSDDEDRPIAERRVDVSRWRGQLSAALAGDVTSHPALPALVELVERSGIPPTYLYEVIHGVASDLDDVTIATFADLERYCYLVAGVVGLCCIHIWGFRDERAKPLAVDCGTALQLTNILRDLTEDADKGRLYLPADEMEQFGYTLAELRAGEYNAAFRALMEFQVGRAREYYRRAHELFEYLEPVGQPVLSAMLRIYGGLLEQIERKRYNVLGRRIRLSTWRKLWICGDTFVRGRRADCGVPAAAVPTPAER